MPNKEQIDKIAKRLSLADAQNIQGQANARYILYGVREEPKNFPQFNVNLTASTALAMVTTSGSTASA